MAILPQPFLFSWEHIEAQSDLVRLKWVLSALPDEELMLEIEAHRGRGRNDYPVRATWNSILAGFVFQHKSIASLRRELRRNGELRKACGFDPLGGIKAVPSKDAYTHFLNTLLARIDRVMKVFDKLVGELERELPDLGAYLAGDSKAIASAARARSHEQTREIRAKEKREGRRDRRRDIDADWGIKQYRGDKSNGKPYEKIIKWFGYKLHLIVDSTYELPLGFKVTKASRNDTAELLPMMKELKKRHPRVVRRAKEGCWDKAYDSRDNCAKLYDDFGVKPVIDIRSCWQGSEKTRLLDPKKADNVVYDEKGQLFCTCPVSHIERPMAYWGYEEDRKAQKFVCPAAVYGFRCRGRDLCYSVRKKSGRIVRVPISIDRRVFTPLARTTYRWATSYKRRTAVERVNSRLDRVLGFEEHHIRGLGKITVQAGLALIVILAMALGAIKSGQKDRMRCLVSLVVPRARAA